MNEEDQLYHVFRRATHSNEIFCVWSGYAPDPNAAVFAAWTDNTHAFQRNGKEARVFVVREGDWTTCGIRVAHQAPRVEIDEIPT